MALEFIIGITEHRVFGNVMAAYLIEESHMFYKVRKLVKSFDLEDSIYDFKPHEKEIVKLIESYSDEALIKKFTRKKDNSNFFQNLDSELFQNHISPFIDKQITRCIYILMHHPVRVYMKQSKYSNLYSEDEIKVNRNFSSCIFKFDKQSTGTKYSLELEHLGKRFGLLHKQIEIVSNHPCSFVYQNKLFAFEKVSAKKIVPFLEKESVFIPSQVEEKYYKSFVLNTIRDYRVEANGFNIHETKADKQAILSLEPNLQYKPSLYLRFMYGSELYDSNTRSEVFVRFSDNNGTYSFEKIRRDKNWEKQTIELLHKLELVEQKGSFTIEMAEMLDDQDTLYELLEWVKNHKTTLEENGFIIQQRNLDKTYSTESQDLDIELKADADWFDVYTKVQIGSYQIPFIQLKKYILNGIREFELPNGEIAILPKEWFTRYQDILPFAKITDNGMRLKKFHYQMLRKNLKGIDKTYFRKLEAIGSNNKQKAALPANINATLRAYQEEGFQWMFHLYEHGFGGCLADDMGLGKTLQTLALLLKFNKLKKDIHTPIITEEKGQFSFFENENVGNIQPASLIVMPTSLIHNWENEIKKFTPSLKVYKHVGTQRNRSNQFDSLIKYYDIILTTYGTLRNDIEILSKHRFFYLILDESQYIKNSGSKTYKAIRQMQSQQRLVLTGTPIENSLSDLWSQFNFLNPGLLGNEAFFKREFQTPIEKKNDKEKQEKLQLLIRPFVLRRTKEEVAKDLPDLTEQIRYCNMAGGQKEFYEKEKSFIRNTILQNIEKQGMEKSAFVVLQGLTRLRQLANHPSMLETENKLESGKFDEIFRCLENLMAENHKVLIFSSFVKHLELLKKRIELKKWKYSILTGQTTKREEVINKFRDEEDNRIFLISLKAGGVGLNLTSADYVFIIDPWWNPAAENQAINRAHRIGQNKKVFVYRFITEHSIEEKIQLLKEKKSSLAEKFVNSNNPFKAITKDEILSLFS